MKLNKEQKRKKAETILCGLSKIADRPTDKKGNLDVEAFNELPEVKKAKNKLGEFGITQKWLSDNGFMIACMVLRF